MVKCKGLYVKEIYNNKEMKYMNWDEKFFSQFTRRSFE